VKQDGTDRRLEFRDTLGAWKSRYETVSLSISPDGKSVAWPRTLGDEGMAGHSYQELMVHDLGTGRGRQLTFNKKNINEVCWTRNNQIIFSSDIAGNFNLCCG
jgi:tricorn protease-like protein